MTDTQQAPHSEMAWPSNQTIEETDADLRSQIESFIEDATEEDRHFLNEVFYLRERSFQGHKLGLAEAVAEMLGVEPRDFRLYKDKAATDSATALHAQFHSVESFKSLEYHLGLAAHSILMLSPLAREAALRTIALENPQLLADALAAEVRAGRVNIETAPPSEEVDQTAEEFDAEVNALVEEAIDSDHAQTAQK